MKDEKQNNLGELLENTMEVGQERIKEDHRLDPEVSSRIQGLIMELEYREWLTLGGRLAGDLLTEGIDIEDIYAFLTDGLDEQFDNEGFWQEAD